MRGIASLVAVVALAFAGACRKHESPKPQPAPTAQSTPTTTTTTPPAPPTHAGPYVVHYDCTTEQQNGTRTSEKQTLDLGTHTRTTVHENTVGEPVAQHAPDMLVQMASDTVTRVLAGSGYQPEPATAGAASCQLSIVAADKATVFQIEKSDVRQKDAVTELVHVFRP